jgi:hypothetical protein
MYHDVIRRQAVKPPRNRTGRAVFALRMRRALPLAALVAALLAPARAALAAPDAAGLRRAIVERLLPRRALHPNTHTTDFAIDGLGCITFTRREMRRLRYPGHAFVCEEAAGGQVLGAVLDRSGRVRCHVSGAYAGNACYDLDICGVADTLCLQ